MSKAAPGYRPWAMPKSFTFAAELPDGLARRSSNGWRFDMGQRNLDVYVRRVTAGEWAT